MKFITARKNGQAFVGVLDASEALVLPLTKKENGFAFPQSMIECIELGDEFVKQAERVLQQASQSDFLELDAVELLAPIPRPRKNIFCVGKNYREHVIEMGSKDDIPEHVMVFTKVPTTVIASGAPILSHQEVTEQLDYEGELAVIIGKEGKAITKEEALDYIFGYTILNDVTARDLQSRHKQFFIGKSLDTTCPLGPCIVHKSVITDPSALQIETKVNGEVRQSSEKEKMIFSISEIISVLSQGMTLEPGDIIATGTPSGVGKGFNPPRFLRAGDEIEITIDQIGVLKNTVSN
ncbi:fumarylacetoacetate hydrolase family protein [Peribacillus asahii]|uniref:fumarylacetoacetate hydrolase family protein n=1 Tax=Peribacillus asahii TaxID=228899 RepID=UPI00207A9D0D|nr:fumarylacetoacetate hydrolase family protein [Peribacillus asahii]USK86936.1 fumarylacetoacetate hydrolase family protein [Peribacillus asahii]